MPLTTGIAASMTFPLLPLSPLLPRRLLYLFGMLVTLWLSGCGSAPLTGPITSPVPGQLSGAASDPAQSPRPVPHASNAATPRDYRRDAAQHIYESNRNRIYAGKLPPLLYAVGTLQVSLDATGRVVSMHWMRAPRHAPDAIAEIERTVLQASPFPVASRLGKVTWTDTWLWDKSGRFQIDTLSEGQQ